MFDFARTTMPTAFPLVLLAVVLCMTSAPSPVAAQGKKYVTKPFDSYRVTYAITNPNGKDYARIDYYYAKDKKVGQMLFGDSITPGAYASLQGDEIHLYFPLKHFEAIAGTLRSEKNLALYVELDPMEKVSIGGLTNALEGNR